MKTILAIAILFAATARADFPPNNAYVPDEGEASFYAVPKTRFNSLMELAERTYAPIVKSLANCTLQIEGDWYDGTVNAYASRIGSVCKVEMFGGFARYGTMTSNAFLGVICHEIGHHIGGTPRYRGDWASCEGQSDYFAQQCLRKFISASAAKAAGDVLGKNLARLSGEPVPRYSTPDRSKANGIYCSHPGAQCRMDTYLAGLNGRARPACWYNP